MDIRIKKKDGSLEPLDIMKIRKHTEPACRGLGLKFEELERDAKIFFIDGMPSDNIQDSLILTAKNKIDIDRPNWTYVAARLELQRLYRDLGHYEDFLSYLETGIKEGYLRYEITDSYTKDEIKELESYIKPERDEQFTYLGLITLMQRYLMRNKDGNIVELPQYMFMGIAMMLASIEDDRVGYAKKFYDLISKFEVMVATPTLSNSRSPRGQLSSCFVGTTPDNIEGIFDSYKLMAILSKYGGGLGWDWNSVRGLGSTISDVKGAAGGIIPFLKITNDITVAVDQLGTRAGAETIYAAPWHIDIEDFLKLKNNSGEERRRTHDLFPAVWIDDLFMERVVNDEMYSLFDPYDTPELNQLFGEEFKARYLELEEEGELVKKQVRASEIWKTMLIEYWETGNPFLVFKDSANNRNMMSGEGLIRSSNLCLEIFQNTKPDTYSTRVVLSNGSEIKFREAEFVETSRGLVRASKLNVGDRIDGKRVEFLDKISNEDGVIAVCNLASINLAKVNTQEDLDRVVPLAVRLLDNVVTLNRFPVKQAYNSKDLYRAIGLGAMGEMEMLANKQIHFGCKEHLELIDVIYENISYSAILASSLLGKERGSFNSFDKSSWVKGELPIDSYNRNTDKLIEHKPRRDWDSLRGLTSKHMRNAYLLAIAPTSSISILTGTSQAIEPVFKRKWIEENKTGQIPVTAPGINIDNYEYYKPVSEIDQQLLVKAGAIRQKWLDQGQSLNIFKEEGKVKHVDELSDLYILAWHLGLKSTYYLRTTSPKEEVADRSIECSGCQ